MIDDFYSYQKSFSLEDMREAARFYRTLFDKTGVCIEGGEHVVILTGEDEALDRLVLKYLCMLKLLGMTTCVVIAERGREAFIDEHITTSYIYTPVDGDTLERLCRYYAIAPIKGMMHVSAMSLVSDTNMYRILECSEMSLEDIASYGVLDLEFVPSEEDIAKNRDADITRTENADVDWTRVSARINYVDRPMESAEYLDKSAEALRKNYEHKDTDRYLLFGVMKTTKEIRNRLTGYNIVGFVDNNPELAGTTVEGLFVCTPQEIKNRWGEDIKIIISSRYTFDMAKQLMGLGFDLDYNIRIAYAAYRNNLAKSFGINEVDKKIKRGQELYDRIRKDYKDETIIHLPYTGTGDAFFLGLYFSDIKKLHGIDHYIILSASSVCDRVLQLFGETAVIVNRSESEDLIAYTRLKGFRQTNYIVMNDCIDQDIVIRLRGWKGLDFHSLFRKVVYKVDQISDGSNVKRVPSDDIFEKNSLRKGKTVLISPYATTVESLSQQTWQRMVDTLKNKGFDVCTNVAGKEEPILGSIPLNIPFDQVIDFVEQAGFFIGIRSGLCDILAFAKARKVIFYPVWTDRKSSLRNHNYRYYSLRKMGLCTDDLLEIQFAEGKETDIADVTCQFISHKEKPETTCQNKGKACAVFLDRDGTINEDRNYLHSVDDFQYKDGVIEGLKKLSELGFKIIVVTNQSGIARGMYTEEDFLKLNDWMIKDMRQKGINALVTFYCPHHPEGPLEEYRMNCDCRKPDTGLFWKAAEKYDINMEGSFAIGDRLRDLAVVNESGARGILISDEREPVMDRTIVCRDFLTAVDNIEEYMNGVDPWKS